MITHPSYHKPVQYSYDIALLKLVKPAQLNRSVFQLELLIVTILIFNLTSRLIDSLLLLFTINYISITNVLIQNNGTKKGSKEGTELSFYLTANAQE